MENINIKNLFNSPNASSTQIVSENELQKLVDVLTSKITELENNPVDSRPYKVYTAILFQNGTDAPVAKVLESTLSNAVSWVRTEAGVYNIGGNTEISNGVLVSHRSLNFSTNVGVGYILSFNGAELYTQRSDNLNYSDNLLDSTLIEIRVYN